MIEFLLNTFIQGVAIGVGITIICFLIRDWLRYMEREAFFKELAKKSRERHKALFEAQDVLIRHVQKDR